MRFFVRSGRWAMRAAKGPGVAFAGLHASCARWLHDRGVAVLGADADPEVIPSQVEGMGAPIHLLALVAMGLPLFDECDLEDLGREAAKRKRWVFLFTAAPLAVPGGTANGAAVNRNTQRFLFAASLPRSSKSHSSKSGRPIATNASRWIGAPIPSTCD